MATGNKNESAPKEISPNIRAGQPTEGDKLTRRYDLVEQMQFLFVRVVKARNLHNNASDPYVEIKLGNMRATTFFFDKKSYPEWNQVFAFEKHKIHALNIEVLVKGKAVEGLDMLSHAILGRVVLNLSDVPKRVPPESALAPQWYMLEDQTGANLPQGDIMLSLWMGTQADEYFPHGWCSDATKVSVDAVGYTRSKVYMSPTLWYLRVNVIQAQDLLLKFDPKSSDIFVQADLGGLRVRTSFSKKKGATPFWNEDLMFVAQEPFSDTLVLSVEQGTLTDHVSLGRCELHLKDVDKRLDDVGVDVRWFNLNWPGIIETAKEVKFASKLCARVTLDGAYHVMDEHVEYTSDFRPSVKELWKSSIGVLELGILKGTNLVPMKMNNRTDAYCVAKYGPKWVRTRTIVDSLSPKWNEQYIWEVYEPFTVITIVVFDNNQVDANTRARGAKDAIMGKIRIRLSTLDCGKVYTHSYPLIGLQPSGVKKMGEIHLAVRFSWPFLSSLNMYQLYLTPLFPLHHHILPLSPTQCDNLRKQAVHVIAQGLSRAEPPLTKEVVFYMLDMRSDIWSIRKGRANFNRVMNLVGGFVALWKWLDYICTWKSPVTTLLFHFQCILMLLYPEPLLPLLVFYLFWVGLKAYFKRPRNPCHIDANLSGADIATPEDLEEELEMFPTQLEGETLRRRYDRLRVIGRNTQILASDLATILERLHSLSSWRDPRATQMFLLFCVVGFLVTVTVSAKVIIFFGIIYYLRHPRFRSVLPSVPANFLKRMPSKQAFIL